MAESCLGQNSALRLVSASTPDSSSVPAVSPVTAEQRYAQAYARWARAKANEGRRDQYTLDMIRIRALDAMLEARVGR